MLRFSRALLALALISLPLVAMQGSGVGTLPRTGPQRNVAWLSSWSRIALLSDPGAQFVIGSTHDAEEQLAQSPPNDPSTMTASWRSRHTTFTLSCPSWSSEVGDEGMRHHQARFALELTEAQLHFPPDGT